MERVLFIINVFNNNETLQKVTATKKVIINTV